MEKIRILKVHSKVRYRRWDNTTVPEIRLEGKWLEQLGFEQGNEIIIKQNKKKLTITLKKKEQNK